MEPCVRVVEGSGWDDVLDYIRSIGVIKTCQGFGSHQHTVNSQHTAVILHRGSYVFMTWMRISRRFDQFSGWHVGSAARPFWMIVP